MTPITSADSEVSIGSLPQFVIKRNGSTVEFTMEKIAVALEKCYTNSKITPKTPIPTLVASIENIIRNTAKFENEHIPNIEEIQDIVEMTLLSHEEYAAAKNYILYRAERTRLRKERPIPEDVKEAFAKSDVFFPTQIQKFQFYDKYSRFDYKRGRRETWVETVNRSVNFLIELSDRKLDPEVYARIRKAILEMKIMPSMRLLAMAGEAARRNNICIYNCSFVPVDSLDAFVETLVISMNGCGVGYSVERYHVEKLPRIQRQNGKKHPLYVVDDTADGWADALRFGLNAWFNGEDVEFDLSGLRPYGAPLKVKGGRSSGPEPLRQLLSFVRTTVMKRQGSFLTSLDAHDIMCVVGTASISGGVRRTALIALFDFDDVEMLNCKHGDFPTHRWNANNSAVWPDRELTQEEIMNFMNIMVQSGRGEPGIYNRRAVFANAPARRLERGMEPYIGTNPCFTGETLVAVADGRNAVSISELAKINNKFPVYSAKPINYSNQSGESNSFSHWRTEIKWATAFKTGEKETVKVILSNGDHFECTADHKLATHDGKWVEAKDSEGIKLEKFFTTTPEARAKHRYINSYSNGYNKQHRLIWEFYNGSKPEGYDIDHIINNGLDNIENLQLLPKQDHLKKTSFERRGSNNPAFRIRDVIAHRLKLSVASSNENNPNYGGMTDGEMIELGRSALKDRTVKVFNAVSLKKLDSRFPLSFSKNRFNGSFKLYTDIVKGLVEYIPPVTPVNNRVCYSPMNLKLSEAVYVVRVEHTGETKEVYDLTVEDNHNFYIITSGDENFSNSEGVLVHNCGEINLYKNFCNLSSAVCRSDDDIESLREKVELATIIGTIQSMATHFPGMRPEWSQNSRRERLLGVDLNGEMDSPIVQSESVLQMLRELAVQTNAEYAAKLGIEQSVSVTTVKPSGNSSQLLNASSGIHSRWAPYYIRNVRVSSASPIFKVLQEEGVPMDPENGFTRDNATTWVVHFPVKSPEGSITRNGRSAIEQCEYWKKVRLNYTEHNPSATITYKPSEVIDIVKWVWENQSIIGGLTFLPSFDAKYDQMPYEEISEQEYITLAQRFPNIDFSKIFRYEESDLTTASQELACMGGHCEM